MGEDDNQSIPYVFKSNKGELNTLAKHQLRYNTVQYAHQAFGIKHAKTYRRRSIGSTREAVTEARRDQWLQPRSSKLL
jgi:hypothetical protein